MGEIIFHNLSKLRRAQAAAGSDDSEAVLEEYKKLGGAFTEEKATKKATKKTTKRATRS
jgi:hypothetical protein